MKLSSIFLLTRSVLLVFVLPLISISILGCEVIPVNPTSTLIPTPTLGNMISYLVHVRDQETGENISKAEVIIEVGGIAPLNSLTDSSGVARIQIPAICSGKPGFLIVSSLGFETYAENMDIIEGNLPDNIQLTRLKQSHTSEAIQVEIEVQVNGEIIEGVKVVIQRKGQPDLIDTTDVNGIARISIPHDQVGQTGVLLIETEGYKTYRQHIDLVEGALPDVIQLEMVEAMINLTSTLTTTEVASSTSVTLDQAEEFQPPTSTLTTTEVASSIPVTLDQAEEFQLPTSINTPIPPDAIVTVEKVVLYDGPGIPGDGNNYTILKTLPSGTKLDILRSVCNKIDWIKVAVVSNTDQFTTGYVNIATGNIKINVDLDDTETYPPMYEYGPSLLNPQENVERPFYEFTTFDWNEVGDLQENQRYSLSLYLTDQKPGDACYHDQYTKPSVDIIPSDYPKCIPGVYYWSVGIATKLLDEYGNQLTDEHGNLLWRDDSERDERRIVGLGVPPPDRPSNGNKNGDKEDPGELPFIE